MGRESNFKADSLRTAPLTGCRNWYHATLAPVKYGQISDIATAAAARLCFKLVRRRGEAVAQGPQHCCDLSLPCWQTGKLASLVGVWRSQPRIRRDDEPCQKTSLDATRLAQSQPGHPGHERRRTRGAKATSKSREQQRHHKLGR